MIESFAEACYRWTPEIALGSSAVFLGIERCRKLYREETLLGRLRVFSRKFSLRKGATVIRIGVANDPSTALALSRRDEAGTGVVLDFGEVGRPQSLAVESLVDYVEPFARDREQDGALSDVLQSKLDQTRQMIGLLRRLGVASLGDFARLPAKTFPSRFGALGLELKRRVERGYLLPWPRFTPAQQIVERSAFEASDLVLELEPLLLVLSPLLERALARVRGRFERVARFRITARLERFSTIREPVRSWEWAFPMPQGSLHDIVKLVREKLQFELSRKALEAPVTELELEILETAPGRVGQQDFFHRQEREREEWSSLFNRLSQRLGLGKAFLAGRQERYLPEGTWRRLDSRDPEGKEMEEKQMLWSMDSEAKGAVEVDAFFPFSNRPLRLLKRPLPLLREGDFLRLWGDSGRNWRISEVDGPEILSGEWWRDPFERSYYRVATEQGEVLWVFEAPESEGSRNRLFLHGIFD